MTFAPKPENDFAQFIQTYYDYCRSCHNCIEAIAGKWMFRDLIPGMSDFDTRFIVNNQTTPDDWCRLSMAIGNVHLQLCQRHPCWARNLEHLPGVNLTWNEFTEECCYYPEFKQWTFYHSSVPATMYQALDQVHRRPWDARDEYFHLKKFCLYFGRYNRTIDKAINLGVHENKYPLHSRIMHYFLPPLQSALCVLLKRSITGKFEALEMGEAMFPNLDCWQGIGEILNANYESPQWYREENLTLLEDWLEDALTFLLAQLRGTVSLIPSEAGVDMAAWRQALGNIKVNPYMILFDNVRFCRLMKGRLWFYANAPDFFDADFLIQNELNRIGNNFLKVPFTIYWKLKSGEDVSEPLAILDRFDPGSLSKQESAATREFARLTMTPQQASRIEVAQEIIAVFDDFFRLLLRISEEAKQLSRQHKKGLFQ